VGVTLDVGHLNIEGEDPLVGAVRVGHWCREHGIFLRVHATNNYGLLLFSPPSFSADVHFNVSGKGINNSLIIRALRSVGSDVSVVAEQISPLTEEDFNVLEQACTSELPGTFEDVAAAGEAQLSDAVTGGLIDEAVAAEPAYQFAAGLVGVNGLREYLVYRIIQSNKHLSVDDAARISREYTRMPQALKSELTVYMDDLLLPLQMESGVIQKSQLDLICQNIDGNLFRAMDPEDLRQVFSCTREYAGGDVICRQGDTGFDMFMLHEGKARVCIDKDRVATLGPGEIFGEISLFYHIPRSAAVIAEATPTVIGVLTREGFEHLLTSQDPALTALIGRLYRALPVRLRNMNERYKLAIRSLRLLSGDEDHRALPDEEGAAIGEQFARHENVPALLSEEALLIYERITEFEGNEVVFSEGDAADGLYVILEGEAEVLAMNESPPIVLGYLSEGDIFGELAIMGNSARTATVRTLRYTRAAFLSLERFTRFMDTGSELSFRFMGLLCLLLFRRIVHLDRAYSEAKRALREATAPGAEATAEDTA
jgi:CRP-like cAMP-binding protein